MAYDGYFFDEQLAKFQIQFMSIFEDLTVRTGKRKDGNIRSINVPVTYGSRDRVTASIMANNTQNALIKVPTMSAYMTGLEIANDRMKGSGMKRSFTYLPTGGVFPTDLKVVTQIMPVPYNMELELAIFSSNSHQQRQILEQILVFFDPIVQIQKSDGVFDMTRITTVELKNINLREEYPTNDKHRVLTTELTFNMPIWLAVPADEKANFINRIYTRLSILNTDDNFADYISNTLDGIEEYNPSSGTEVIITDNT